MKKTATHDELKNAAALLGYDFELGNEDQGIGKEFIRLKKGQDCQLFYLKTTQRPAWIYARSVFTGSRDIETDYGTYSVRIAMFDTDGTTLEEGIEIKDKDGEIIEVYGTGFDIQEMTPKELTDIIDEKLGLE